MFSKLVGVLDVRNLTKIDADENKAIYRMYFQISDM